MMIELGDKRIDTWTKAAGFSAAFVYICGYLIITIRNTNFGFSAGDLLKPRILAAGITFSFLCVYPSYLAHKALPDNVSSTPADRARKAIALLAYLFEIYTSSFLLLLLLHGEPAGPTVALNKKEWIEVLVVLVCVCITVYFKGKGDQYAENRPNLIAVLGYLCLVAVLCVQIGNVMHALAATNTWLILAGLFGCWIYRRIVRGELGLAALAFISYLFMIGMTYYADLVFPHIYQRWGGGHPVPIAIEILAKGTNKVDDFKRAELIDQDSTGLFVQYSNLDIAVFVPKESIYRVCYLEKAQPHDLSLVLIPSLADDSKVTSFEGCSP